MAEHRAGLGALEIPVVRTFLDRALHVSEPQMPHLYGDSSASATAQSGSLDKQLVMPDVAQCGSGLVLLLQVIVCVVRVGPGPRCHLPQKCSLIPRLGHVPPLGSPSPELPPPRTGHSLPLPGACGWFGAAGGLVRDSVPGPVVELGCQSQSQGTGG